MVGWLVCFAVAVVACAWLEEAFRARKAKVRALNARRLKLERWRALQDLLESDRIRLHDVYRD